MIYEINYTESASKDLNKFQKQDKVRILKSIQKLANNPRKGDVRPMVGIDSWRLRVGTYRVIYDITDNILLVTIVKVAHRKNVYRK